MLMHNWLEGEIYYEKINEAGMNVEVIEPYLVDALSFTEAEARLIEGLTPFISGEFTVSDVKRVNYKKLSFSDGEAADRWPKCKLLFVVLDEKSGVKEHTPVDILIQAADLQDAVKKLDEDMKGATADYQIGAMSETPIMDVYPYENKKEESESGEDEA